MHINIKKFDEFSNTELYAVLKLRAEIFIVEQECAYLDTDDYDQEAIHVCGSIGEELIAYTRLLKPGIKHQGASLGRVITKSNFRRKGYGGAIMAKAIKNCREFWPGFPIRISAQEYLEKFYTDLGFTKLSKPYMEDGMPHIAMVMQTHIAR